MSRIYPAHAYSDAPRAGCYWDTTCDLPTFPVLGNHDVHLLRVAAGTRKLGARDTLDEVLAAST